MQLDQYRSHRARPKPPPAEVETVYCDIRTHSLVKVYGARFERIPDYAQLDPGYRVWITGYDSNGYAIRTECIRAWCPPAE